MKNWYSSAICHVSTQVEPRELGLPALLKYLIVLDHAGPLRERSGLRKKPSRKCLMPFIDTSTLQTGERLPGWVDRSFSSEKMTFAHFTFQAGSKIHEHCHSNEEVWTVIEGELEVSVGADLIVAGPGCVAIVPPYTAHSVRAITHGKAIVTDCPVRLDPSAGRRGWVQIQFDTPFPIHDEPADSPIQIPYTLRNLGKTRAVIRDLTLESKIAPTLPPATTTEIPSGELPMHRVLEADETDAGTIFHTGLTLADLEQLRSGTSIWYVKGVIFYDDDFGSRQHSTFCRIHDCSAFEGKGGYVAPEKPGYNYGT
jgi:unsaturated pyranuronate lyase